MRTISFDGWHFDDLNNETPPSYHARPSNYSFKLNITLSPNLTVDLEAQSTNNSILEIGSNVYLNGTVLSRGRLLATKRDTYLGNEEADISGPFVELSSWYLNNSSWGLIP